MVMFTVDKPSSAAWYSMVLRAAKPLWVPRHTVAVPAVNSAVFRVGDFQVRIGEVKQTAPQTRTRGTIVEIEYTDPSVRHRRRRQPRRHTQHGDGGAASDTTDSEMRDDPLLEESSDAESEGSFGVFEETGSGHGASSAGPTNIDGTDDGDGSLAAGAIEPVTDPARQPRLRASKAPTSLSILTQEDWEIGEVLIREFWKRFAVPNAREYIRVKDVGLESSLARERGVARLTATTDAPGGTTKAAGLDGVAGADLARQYMEAFRFNR
ncbi:hypothetical protein KEM52_005759 [Ascosphaera acerosa]|nr:hypothetical protein KEM52_005759 [Ascosphaera acerosa]